MKKFFEILVWILLAAAIGFIAFVASGYAWSLRDREAVSVPGLMALEPAGNIPLGGPVRGVIELPLPLYRKVIKAEIKPGAGTIVSGAPSITSTWSWSQRRWKISVELRAFRTGAIVPGVAAIELSPARGKDAPEVFEAAIPGFTVKAPAPDVVAGELELADAVSPSSEADRRWLWWLLPPVAALLIWLGFRFRRGAPPSPEPLWKRTLSALELLRAALRGEKLPMESGVAKLTDIVRGYLEQRYALPATRKTTPEFLEEIDRNNPLPTDQRPFLRDFLTAADLIKFAKAPADFGRIEHAITSAETLVESTREPEEGEK